MKASKEPSQKTYEEWYLSNKLCEICHNTYMWETGWYDDDPSDGGTCIGSLYECGNCGYYKTVQNLKFYEKI